MGGHPWLRASHLLKYTAAAALQRPPLHTACATPPTFTACPPTDESAVHLGPVTTAPQQATASPRLTELLLSCSRPRSSSSLSFALLSACMRTPSACVAEPSDVGYLAQAVRRAAGRCRSLFPSQAAGRCRSLSPSLVLVRPPGGKGGALKPRPSRQRWGKQVGF